MDEANKKAFELAQDTSKQIITLATAIVALTLTFFKDFAGGASPGARVAMTIAWVLFFLAIVAGVLHLLALTGALTTSAPSINAGSARLFAGAEQILFLLGLFLALIAGWLALTSSSAEEPEGPNPAVISVTPETITVVPSTITIAPNPTTVTPESPVPPSTTEFAPSPAK
jgi:hypothetical protein